MPLTNEFLQAISNYLKGKPSREEQDMLNEWYHSFDDSRVKVEVHQKKYEAAAGARIRKRIQASTGIEITSREVHKIKLLPRIAGAAASLLLVLGIGFYNTRYGHNIILNLFQDSAKERYANDIPAPIGNKARLTLPTGKTINLNDTKTGIIIDATKLTYSDGSKITDATPPEAITSQMTITTPRGSQYQVKLPDGSIVTLNAASSLQFPSKFTGLNERRVILKGEGYFAVVHNSTQPFRVQSANQIVEDIGTEFNINAYTDEGNIKTTLIEGSAKVSTRHPTSQGAGGASSVSRTREVTLTPGNQSVLQGEVLRVGEVDPSDAISWKNGLFRFQNANIQTVMRQLARWYDVEIVYEGIPPNSTINGEVYKNMSAAKVLQVLKNLKVNFRIEGRKIIVTQ